MPANDALSGPGGYVGEILMPDSPEIQMMPDPPEIKLIPDPQEISILEVKKNDISRDITPPDGGWGWLIVLGAFIITMLSSLLSFTFSLVYSSFFIEKKISTTMTAWMFNCNQFSWNLFAFFGNSLCARYGWRNICFLGGLIMSISTAVSCLVEEPWHIFITFSVFAGIGQGFCVMASISIIPHYFDKKKGLASGPPIAGISAAQFIGPLLVRHLLENYGFRGTNLLLGGILLHSCFFAMFFHPVEWHAKKRPKNNLLKTECHGHDLKEIEKSTISSPSTPMLSPSTPMLNRLKERRRSSVISLERISLSLEKSSMGFMEGSTLQIQPQTNEIGHEKKVAKEENILKLMLTNIRVLKWHRAKIISLSIPLILSAYMNFLMIVPLSMISQGFSLNMTSWALATAGICNLISRLATSALTDFLPISTKYYFMTGALGIFISMITFTHTSNPTIILSLMFVFGTCVGACGGLISLIPLEFMSLQDTTQVLGLYGLLNAILFIAVGPLIGVIRDATQSFNTAIQILSVVPVVAFVLWLFMPLAITSDAKRKAKISNTQYYLQNS